MGRAGIVLGLEVSRLARNNADWHRLLQICAMSATLICDEDGLYDPTDFNDRLLLGPEGHHERGRTALHPGPAGGRATVQGPPRRTADGTAGRAGLRPGRQGRARPGYRCATSHPAPVQPVRPHRLGARDRAAVQRRRGAVPGAGAHRRPQGRAGLDAAAALAGAAHPAQPPLRRRIRLRPPPRTPRPQRQEDLRHPAPRAVDRADPRRPPRLHQLGPIRNQPETVAGQRHRARRRPRRRPRPGRNRPAAGPGHLRALRAPDDGALPHPPRRARSPTTNA